MKHNPGFLKLVDDARARVAEVDIDTVRSRQEAQDRFVLVDVREESEWRQSRIPGAVYLGRGVIERDVEGRYPDHDTDLVLYCGGGYRSVLAADNLVKMGYQKVASMMGGIRDWRERGLPIDDTPPPDGKA